MKKFNVEGFDFLAKNIFNKSYSLIAKQIVEYTNIKNGNCIEIGSAGGYLGIEIAKLTDMNLYLVDIEEESFKIANKNISEEKLGNRIVHIVGDVHNLKFNSNFADLIISRNSYDFWENIDIALDELYRVLKPKGKMYIGNGYGSNVYKKEIEEKMYKINPKKWYPDKKTTTPKEFKNKFTKFLNENSIEKYNYINDDRGNWIIIEK